MFSGRLSGLTYDPELQHNTSLARNPPKMCLPTVAETTRFCPEPYCSVAMEVIGLEMCGNQLPMLTAYIRHKVQSRNFLIDRLGGLAVVLVNKTVL
jgi:hypothetical protein